MKNETKHTPGDTAEINNLGYWIPVVYYPDGPRAEVGNAQYTKERAEEVSEMMWGAALRNWERGANVNLIPDAPDYVIARRDNARAAIAKATGK